MENFGTVIYSDIDNFLNKASKKVETDLEKLKAMSLEDVAKMLVDAGVIKDIFSAKVFLITETFETIRDGKYDYPICMVEENRRSRAPKRISLDRVETDLLKIKDMPFNRVNNMLIEAGIMEDYISAKIFLLTESFEAIHDERYAYPIQILAKNEELSEEEKIIDTNEVTMKH